MTTQPELPDPSALAAPERPVLRLAPPPAGYDLDFDAFVRSYESRLRRLVMRRIGDISEAEEITQETLLRAYQHRASFATEDELMAWSTVVAQRLVIDRVRVRGRSIAVPDVPETARLGRDTAEVVVARHEARAALESLEAIPTRQAAILWAREVEGLHYEEIAERFGITEPAVRSLLHRGRKALRKEFKERTGSLPLNGLAPFAPWLLALKAAGKMRGAAKSTVKAPATVAAALSLTALVALGIGAVPDARLPGGQAYAAAPVHALNDQVKAVFEAPEAVDRQVAADRARTRSGGQGAAGVVAMAVNLPNLGCDVALPRRGARCVASSDEYFSGAVIQIGPDLPSNPLEMRNIKVSQDQVGCATLGIPSNPAVKCTQHGPTDHSAVPASSDVPAPPRKPGTQSLEGVSR